MNSVSLPRLLVAGLLQELGGETEGCQEKGCWLSQAKECCSLWAVDSFNPDAFCICPLPALSCRGDWRWPSGSAALLQRKLGFVYLISDLWCTQPLIRGFRRLERGLGPGLMVSTFMGNWATNDSRVAGEQEPDRMTMDDWVTVG